MRRIFPLAAAICLSVSCVSTLAETADDVQKLLAAGNYQAALQQAENGLQQNAGNRNLLLAKGFALVKLNRLDEAIGFYDQLRKVIPDDPEPGNNLAMIFRMQKKYPQAITIFAETIQAFPAYTPAYENLGDTYIELAQSQYRQGFTATGNQTLQAKAALSGEFNRLTAQTIAQQPQAATVPAQTQPAPVAPPSTPVASAAPEPDPAQVEQAIIEKLSAWADAWMSLDKDRYFAHYSQQFQPSEGRTLEEWMQRKQTALEIAEFIKIYLTDIDISYSPQSPDVATVEFEQAYASDRFKGRTRKQLNLKNSNNGWLIVAETNID